MPAVPMTSRPEYVRFPSGRVRHARLSSLPAGFRTTYRAARTRAREAPDLLCGAWNSTADPQPTHDSGPLCRVCADHLDALEAELEDARWQHAAHLAADEIRVAIERRLPEVSF